MEKMTNELQHIISFDDTRLLVLKITESIDELKQQLSRFDSSELEKIISEKRKLEFLGVRVAMKILLGEEKTIRYDVDGKPSLKDKSYQISISHSGKWIAVMAHPTRPVGIDIEIPTAKIQKLYKRFLNDTEQEELSEGKNTNQLLLAWSAKETLYKIIGKEAVDFLNQLRIFPFNETTIGKMTAEHIPTKKKYQLHYIQNSEYTLVYCLS